MGYNEGWLDKGCGVPEQTMDVLFLRYKMVAIDRTGGMAVA